VDTKETFYMPKSFVLFFPRIKNNHTSADTVPDSN